MVNKPLTLNGPSLPVVGVAQAGFSGVQIGRSTDVFIPVTMKALLTPGWDGLAAPDDAWLDIIGQLKAGFTPRTAEAANAPTVHAIEESELPFLKIQPGGREKQEYLAGGFSSRPARMDVRSSSPLRQRLFWRCRPWSG